MLATSVDFSIATGGSLTVERNRVARLGIDQVVSASNTRWRRQRAVHRAIACRRAGHEGPAGFHSTQ
jgi:hypothetical protein